MTAFRETILHATGRAELISGPPKVIQVNVGLRCNLNCHHCHLSASPTRNEQMTWPVMEEIVRLTKRCGCTLVDITGGAPELNPHLPAFIDALALQRLPIQVRTNLSVLLEPKMEQMASFFRHHKVILIGSLPCYLETNVDQQRGRWGYQKAIAALRQLNDLGYGHDPELILNLVYNPLGPQLPPDPCQLESDFRRQLMERHGIVFSRLLTITNMPIGRFHADLARLGRQDSYHRLLQDSFNPATLDHLMCRHQISIAWDGTLFDCDFNLALQKPIQASIPPQISGLDPTFLDKRPIVIDDHCFACTAGRGSSCAGALMA
ncbi:MAG: arsenosugar biosynthesis radical SAM protein ArsS [Magnetococcales bacterium]|nr:arsenosugar biosynthesis radical SAM protein ArsS [Magnetococcales bacterium]